MPIPATTRKSLMNQITKSKKDLQDLYEQASAARSKETCEKLEDIELTLDNLRAAILKA